MEKLKIALVEPHDHTEVVYSLLNFFREVAYVEIYASVNCKIEIDQLEENRNDFSFFTLNQNHSFPAFIDSYESRFNKLDWVIFITIEKNYDFYFKKKWHCKTLLIIHDGNFWFDYHNNLIVLSIYDVLKLFKSIMKQSFKYRKKIVEKIDYITFCSSFPFSSASSHFVNTGHIDESKVFPFIPFVTPLRFDSLPYYGNDNSVTIVIPGSIRKNTRLYEPLIKVFTQLGEKLSKNVTVILLGSPVDVYGKKIQRAFKSIAHDQLNIVIFNDVIQKINYDKYLSKADFIILPLRGVMQFGGCREIGGVTKIAGVFNDAIRFNKPAIVSNDYKYDHELCTNLKSYADENELLDLLIKWIANPPQESDVQKRLLTEMLIKQQKHVIEFMRDQL